MLQQRAMHEYVNKRASAWIHGKIFLVEWTNAYTCKHTSNLADQTRRRRCFICLCCLWLCHFTFDCCLIDADRFPHEYSVTVMLNLSAAEWKMNEVNCSLHLRGHFMDKRKATDRFDLNLITSGWSGYATHPHEPTPIDGIEPATKASCIFNVYRIYMMYEHEQLNIEKTWNEKKQSGNST